MLLGIKMIQRSRELQCDFLFTVGCYKSAYLWLLCNSPGLTKSSCKEVASLEYFLKYHTVQKYSQYVFCLKNILYMDLLLNPKGMRNERPGPYHRLKHNNKEEGSIF